MFCSECGQNNSDDAKFCVKCGKKFAVEESPSVPAPEIAQPSKPVSQESPPARSSYTDDSATHVSTALKDSGTVTAMSVIGLVFGLIGMLGSFIPCLGSLAFYIGIPAAIISAIGLFIAYSQNAKRTFAIVALTISLIGVVISGWQYFSIISAGKNAERKLNEMLNQGQTKNESGVNVATPAPVPNANNMRPSVESKQYDFNFNKIGMTKEQAESAIIMFYDNKSEWNGVFQIDYIEKLWVEEINDNQFNVHVRYHYKPVPGNRQNRTDSGNDQRVFIMSKVDNGYQVTEMLGSNSAHF